MENIFDGILTSLKTEAKKLSNQLPKLTGDTNAYIATTKSLRGILELISEYEDKVSKEIRAGNGNPLLARFKLKENRNPYTQKIFLIGADKIVLKNNNNETELESYLISYRITDYGIDVVLPAYQFILDFLEENKHFIGKIIVKLNYGDSTIPNNIYTYQEDKTYSIHIRNYSYRSASDSCGEIKILFKFNT